MTTLPASPPLSYGISMKRKRRHKRLRFGDAFTASFSLGVNTSQQVWQLVWEDINDDDKETIDEFFEDLGSGLLEWEPPGIGEELNFTCGDTDVVYNGYNRWTITVEIEQDFTPT